MSYFLKQMNYLFVKISFNMLQILLFIIIGITHSRPFFLIWTILCLLQEFECDVSVAEGDRRRQEFSFTLYDFDGHGKITKDDIAGLVTTIYDTLGASIQVPPCGSKTIKVKLTVSPDQRASSSSSQAPRNTCLNAAQQTTASPGHQHNPSSCCHVKHPAPCNHAAATVTTRHGASRVPRRRRTTRYRCQVRFTFFVQIMLATTTQLFWYPQYTSWECQGCQKCKEILYKNEEINALLAFLLTRFP